MIEGDHHMNFDHETQISTKGTPTWKQAQVPF